MRTTTTTMKGLLNATLERENDAVVHGTGASLLREERRPHKTGPRDPEAWSGHARVEGAKGSSHLSHTRRRRRARR